MTAIVMLVVFIGVRLLIIEWQLEELKDNKKIERIDGPDPREPIGNVQGATPP